MHFYEWEFLTPKTHALCTCMWECKSINCIIFPYEVTFHSLEANFLLTTPQDTKLEQRTLGLSKHQLQISSPYLVTFDFNQHLANKAQEH